MSAEAIDIGYGVSIQITAYADGTEAGIIETHPHRQTGKPCSGAVLWNRRDTILKSPTWRLISREPLTLEPSILCRECGNHGFIREGRWVPA